MKFPVIFRTPSLLIPGLGHWEKLDREPLDHAFWLFPAEAYRTYAGGGLSLATEGAASRLAANEGKRQIDKPLFFTPWQKIALPVARIQRVIEKLWTRMGCSELLKTTKTQSELQGPITKKERASKQCQLFFRTCHRKKGRTHQQRSKESKGNLKFQYLENYQFGHYERPLYAIS